MAGNTEPEEEGLFENLIGKVAVAAGLAKEVPDDVEQSSPSPALGNNIPPPPQQSSTKAQASVNVASEPDLSAKIGKVFESELNETFAMANPELARYFEQKHIMIDALSASLSGDQLEDAATRAALKASKLTAADINSAFDALKVCRKDNRNSFDESQKTRYEDEVNKPRGEVALIEGEIKALENQVTDLGIQIANKKASVGPVLARATAMETKISDAATVFNQADDKVASALEEMRKNLLSIVSSPK